MASGSFGLTRTGSTSSYITFTCYWEETAQSQANNTTTLKVTVKASKSSSSTASTYGSQTTTVTVGSESQKASGSFTLAPGKTVTLFTKSYTVKHNADGTKSVTIKADVGGNIIYGNGSKTITLTKIPQYATVNTSLVSRTETTATISYKTDATIDYLWYSLNNGSSWSGIDVADGTSGSYTVSNLTSNRSYTILTRVRRKDSQLNTTSAGVTFTTYSYPYANSMPDFTIGSSVTIGLYNPLGRSVRVELLDKNNNTVLTTSTNGTKVTFNTSSVIEDLYDTIWNAKSGTYKVQVYYASQSITKTGGKYNVNTSVCAPTIGSVTYEANDTTSITLNNQLVIQKQSQVEVRASGCVGKYSAEITSAKVEVNGVTYNMSGSGGSWNETGIVIDSANDVTAKVTVTDSRGITASKSVTVTMLAWHTPSAIISIERQNNYYDETDFLVDAEYTSLDGKNVVTIEYSATRDGLSIPITGTLQDNVTSTVVLDKDYEWTITISVSDLFSTHSYTVQVGKGIPLVYFDRVKSSVSINCFPKDNNSLEVNGVNLSKSIMTRSLSTPITDLAVNTYTVIPLDLDNTVGDKLTVTNDGGIQIGANVSKIKVSGKISFDTINTTGNKHLRIIKNSYNQDNTLAWAWENIEQGKPSSIDVQPILANVQEGDVIYICYYTSDSTDKIGGNTYGCRTNLTVETIA